MSIKHWLMKSEPDVFSIDDLRDKKTSLWDGVRNYQARNFMMKDMKIGDQILFYHSNAEPPGVAGVAEVSQLATPDPSQFDKKSDHYDPKSSRENPRWFCVEVKFKNKFKKFVSLDEIRAEKFLQDILVIKKGSRLSIQPVSSSHFNYICKMGEK